MSDIRIDLDRLERATTRLTTVATEFSATEELGQAVEAAVGHPILSMVLADFTAGWSVRRGELNEELTFLAEATRAIHDTFVELDIELAKRAEKLEGELAAQQVEGTP